MLTYNSDANLKELLIAEMKSHKEKDQFIKNKYGKTDENGKFLGCSVGCAIDSLNKILNTNFDHEKDRQKTIKETLGIPEWLTDIQDFIFENLPDEKCVDFAIDFLEAIPVGVDLKDLHYKFILWLMDNNIDFVSSITRMDERITDVTVDMLRRAKDIFKNLIDSNGKIDVNIVGEFNNSIGNILNRRDIQGSSVCYEILYSIKIYNIFSNEDFCNYIQYILKRYDYANDYICAGYYVAFNECAAGLLKTIREYN